MPPNAPSGTAFSGKRSKWTGPGAVACRGEEYPSWGKGEPRSRVVWKGGSWTVGKGWISCICQKAKSWPDLHDVLQCVVTVTSHVMDDVVCVFICSLGFGESSFFVQALTAVCFCVWMFECLSVLLLNEILILSYKELRYFQNSSGLLLSPQSACFRWGRL